MVARGHPTLNSISTNLFVASIFDMPNSDDSTLSTTDNSRYVVFAIDDATKSCRLTIFLPIFLRPAVRKS